MSVRLSFESVSAATRHATEQAQLVWADGHLIAVLAPAQDGLQTGWFLLLGLGPCDVEGLYFPTLDAAQLWVEKQIPQGWGGHGGQVSESKPALS